MKKQFAIAGLLRAIHLPLFAGPPNGNARIAAGTGNSKIVITSTRRLAGAIGSLQWHGRAVHQPFRPRTGVTVVRIF